MATRYVRNIDPCDDPVPDEPEPAPEKTKSLDLRQMPLASPSNFDQDLQRAIENILQTSQPVHRDALINFNGDVYTGAAEDAFNFIHNGTVIAFVDQSGRIHHNVRPSDEINRVPESDQDRRNTERQERLNRRMQHAMNMMGSNFSRMEATINRRIADIQGVATRSATAERRGRGMAATEACEDEAAFSALTGPLEDEIATQIATAMERHEDEMVSQELVQQLLEDSESTFDEFSSEEVSDESRGQQREPENQRWGESVITRILGFIRR